jgi:hypothetical protein
LIGGHVRPFDPFSSARIYQPIINRLRQRNISYQYPYYGINLSVIYSVAGWFFSAILARSKGYSITASLGFAVLGAMLSLLIGTASAFNSNYHPVFHLDSGLLEPRHVSLYRSEQVFNSLRGDRRCALLARSRLLPDDVNSVAQLRLNEYSPSI